MKPDLRYWIRLLCVGIFSGIIIAFVAIESLYVLAFTRPAPSQVGNPPSFGNSITFQTVSIMNEEDSIELSGWYIPSTNQAAIILLHGYGSNRLEMLSRAEVLARYGYGVLLYDLRGHGESQNSLRAFGWDDVGDVNSALQFLSDRDEVDPDRIGILGFSIGGQIAIRAASENEKIKVIIADDPGFVTVDDAPPPLDSEQRFTHLVSRMNSRLISIWTGVPIPPGVIEVIGDITPRPIMFIASGQTGGRDLVRHFYQVADEPKELWEIPETFHGGQFDARPVEYEEKMIGFFNEALLED